MAAENEILITVGLDTDKFTERLVDATKSVEYLKNEQKKLNEEYKDGKISMKEYAVALADNKKNLEAAQRAVKSSTAVLQAETKTIDTATMSLDEQRQTLNTLQKAYAALDGEQRALADGEGGLRDKIKQLTDSLREQEHAIGDDRRSVGNYKESIISAVDSLGPMKGLIEGVAGGTTQLSVGFDRADKVAKGLMKNPVWATFFLLGGVLSTIAAKLKKNEKAMEGINTLTAGIGGSLEALKPILDWLVKYLVEYLLKAINLVTSAVQKVLGWVDKLAHRFGKEFGLAAAFEMGAANAGKLEEAEKKVGKTAEELHEEAKRRWVEEQEAEEAYQELLRKTDEELEKLAKKHEEEKRKAKEWWDTYNQMIADQEAEFVDKQEAALRKWGIIQEDEYTKELQALSADYANKLLNEEEFQEARQLLRDKYNKKQQEAIEEETERQKKAFNSIAKSGANTFNSLAQLVEAFGDDSAEASKAQKGFALAAIIANEAEAIASGVAATSEAIKGATKAGAATGVAAPFTTPAFIAEMVGIVTAQLGSAIGGIVSAKNILSGGKFEQGGIVPGTSYSGDHVGIQANSSEMVLTRDQQSRLFEIANSPMQSSYEATVAAMRAAFSSMPAPVMVYQEFQDFQNRTARYNEIAKV